MLTASEALRLQSAQLTEEEKTARDELLTQIKDHVISHMAFRGCEITVTETRGNVIASVTQALRSLEWQVQWQPLVQQSQLSGKPTITGLLLHLAPSDIAYMTVRESLATRN